MKPGRDKEEKALHTIRTLPVAKVRMSVLRPVAEVFAALTQPEILSRYWLSRASGPLEPGKTVHWEFMVPGAKTDATVTAFEENRHLSIRWSDGSTVDWTVEPQPDNTTIVQVVNAGFSGTPDEVVATALESTQGFTIVLCGLKALLEPHGSLSLVRDKARLIEQALRP